MIKAELLRNPDELKKIENKAGCYKWWCEKDELNIILNALGVNFDDVKSSLEAKDNLFCIYVGIAAKESVRNRLNWHVNDSHTESRVKNGTLSTLRQTISSIVAHNQFDKKATDDFIDKLYVEWFCSDFPIKSAEVKNELHSKERKMLSENLRLLNIQENYHPLAKPITQKLRSLRKESKENK